MRRTVDCIGSCWGVADNRPGMEGVEHHWTADGAVWKSDCGLEVPANDFFHNVPYLRVWVEDDRTAAKVCTACAAVYPSTPIGKLLGGKVVLPQ